MSTKVSDLIKLDSTFIVCITLILLAAIAGMAYYYVTDRTLMASNIENAIAKGIDPITVRCSYAKSDDIICIASSHNAIPSGKK
jgi:hypothetical protein